LAVAGPEAMEWLEPAAVRVPDAVSEAVGGHPVVARALVRRGLCTVPEVLAYLDPSKYRPSSAWELPDMDKAVERLQQAVEPGDAILVWGDFDVDGIAATALLVEALVGLGARVFWHVPNRERESHGLNWRSLQPFLGRGVRLLLTCDTGVSSGAIVLQAQSLGLDIIITDHHDLPEVLPPALALVNPNLLAEDHPLRHLSGAGVAYKVAEALGAGDRGLDLAMLGLVADVVPQLGDVRYLVQCGLRAVRFAPRVGLSALAEVADVNLAEIDEGTIGFSLAPRLNALGRLADASSGVQLLLEQDLAKARTIAAEAEALNVRRQFLSRQVTAAAEEQLIRAQGAATAPIIVLSHSQWPASVLGIAASRLVERYSRPVVLIATPEGQSARGSARSLSGLDIREILAAQGDLLESFGGHPMAAGFSVDANQVPELKRRLELTVGSLAGDHIPEPELAIESYMSLAELTLGLAEDLERLAPFGPGNPPVHLATHNLTVKSWRAIGRTGEHRSLKLQDDEGHTASASWWYCSGLPVPQGRFDLAYVLRVNRFQGERSVQLEWIDTRGAQAPAAELQTVVALPETADYRSLREPLPALRALSEEGKAQVWAEAAVLEGVDARTRIQLTESPTLVVWTSPPSVQVWASGLTKVRPELVCLFAVEPGLDDSETFVRRLAGLVKHGLEAYAGRLTWDALAAAMSHRVETVQTGVDWLASRGQLTIVSTGPERAIVQRGGDSQPDLTRALEARLVELLRETAAYRRHFREADAETLVRVDGVVLR